MAEEKKRTTDIGATLLQKLTDDLPTHTFKYGSLDVKVRAFFPGTTMAIRDSATVKKLRHVSLEKVKKDSGKSEEVVTYTDEEIEKKIADAEEEVNEVCGYFIECVIEIDGADVKEWLNVARARKHFSTRFMFKCIRFAMGDSTIPDEEDLNEVDRFHRQDTEQGSEA